MSQKQRIEELRKKRKKQRESLMSFFKRFQDRLSRFQKIDEPTKSETVGDAQKMRTRTKTSMADAQKMRTRTKTDMSDTQKRPAKAQDTMSATQKRGAVVRSKKDVEDRQKKLQTNLITSRRSKESSNKTTVSDDEKTTDSLCPLLSGLGAPAFVCGIVDRLTTTLTISCTDEHTLKVVDKTPLTKENVTETGLRGIGKEETRCKTKGGRKEYMLSGDVKMDGTNQFACRLISRGDGWWTIS